MSHIETSYFPLLVACLISATIFIVLITYISKHPKKNTKPLKWLFVIMFIAGMGLYCYCHYRELEEVINGSLKDPSLNWVHNENASGAYYIAYIVMMSVIDVGTMFYGRGNSALFYRLSEAENPIVVLGFWLLHTLAFFTASSALLIRFGDDFLRWLRGVKIKVLDVNLVFGINEDSIAFGRNIADEKGSMLVYVDSIVNENYEASIHNLGGLVYSDKDALMATVQFLKDIRIKKQETRLRIYALSGEYDKNLQYARMMSESLEKLQIQPEQTELVLLGTDEGKGMFFQSSENQYGYGKVRSFDEFEMAARLLIHEYPLCNSVNFDENGRATEDMDVLIVGFGRIGHAVLRKVVANGQFEGSSFHATVYDPKHTQRIGFFSSQYPKMFTNYNIDFQPQDGRSDLMFQFLKKHASKLKYVVICLEDREIARDMAIRMVDRLQTMGYSQNVYTCDSKSVRCYSSSVQECKTHWIYDSELLYSDKFDKHAMALNNRYCGGQNSPEEDWKKCSYFHRMSSRASVDYLMPLIHRIKNTPTLTPEQRENLAKCEHLRWCAFHYTFGYDVMELEEFAQRLKDWQAEIKEHGSSNIKPRQDTEKMKHVCLVSWDGLDEVSRVENSFTHGNKNYKDNDMGNVDIIMELVQSEDTSTELTRSRKE